jgi:hypothetical protein
MNLEQEAWECIPDDYYQCIYEDWKAKLKRKGFHDAEIIHSGFGSQGDGASFTATIGSSKLITRLPVSLKEHLKGAKICAGLSSDSRLDPNDFTLANITGNLWGKITRDKCARDCHRFTMNCEVQCETVDFEPLNVWLNEVEREMLEEARSLAVEIYDDLEKCYYAEYDYQLARLKEEYAEEVTA